MQSQPSGDPLVGMTVAGRYKVIKLLGEGGMGQVYLAEHFAIEKRVALKVLRAEYAHKGDIVTRFQQEAISASRIKHPNVLDVFDFGQLENGCFYLAMEFLDGNDLADELQRSRVLSPPRALPIAMQICRALAAAHAKGVVHRDMKPENVFLQRTADGEEIVKIVDFGIAQLKPTNEEAQAESTKHRRLTKTGMIFGTPEYMAPEQASGKHADLRCDIYAVGIILFELFTGTVPFTGETFLGVLTKHLNDVPPSMRAVYPDVQISQELEGVVLRALAKDPTHRFQSMNEFAQALASTPEGQYVGLRSPYSQVAADGRGSFLPGPSPSPTAQQFVGNPSVPHQNGPAGSGPVMTDAARAAVTMPQQDTLQSRAETQLGGQASTRPPTKSGGGAGYALALLGVLVLGGGAAAAFVLKGGETPPAPSAQAKVPDAPVGPETPPVVPSVVVTPPPPASVPVVTAPTEIKLEIVTDPPGAKITKGGFQVCDATPCQVNAKPDEQLELEAQKDALTGKAKVLAQRDQTVTIKLVAPVKAPPKATGGVKMCEFEMVDGLKGMRPCPP
jgi:eukaryotic-like serine/threonine-protein kinase